MKIIVLIIAAVFALLSTEQASAITVSYTVSGSPGNYILDFSVTNNAVGDLYFFGVRLSSNNFVVGTPYGYAPHGLYQFPTATSDGACSPGSCSPSVPIYNTWIDASTSLSSSGPYYNYLLPGTTLSGFQVQISDIVAPTYVDWVAFNCLNPQCGANYPIVFGASDTFGNSVPVTDTPFGSSVSTTPLPPAWTMMLIGLAGFGFIARRRRDNSVSAI